MAFSPGDITGRIFSKYGLAVRVYDPVLLKHPMSAYGNPNASSQLCAVDVSAVGLSPSHNTDLSGRSSKPVHLANKLWFVTYCVISYPNLDS
jgi:hypothetical protein